MTIYINITAEQADERLALCIPDHDDVIILRNASGAFAVYPEDHYAACRRCVRRNLDTGARYTLAFADADHLTSALAATGCIDGCGALRRDGGTQDEGRAVG